MKPLPRGRGEKDGVEIFVNSPRNDVSVRLIKALSFLVVFTAGAILGFSAATNIHQFMSRGKISLPSPVCIKDNIEDAESLNNYIMPKKLKHNMSDDELFWRASMAPRKSKYPYKRMPKVAFLFLTRRNLPLAPLWERFFRGHEDRFSVYVHSLPGHRLNVTRSSPFFRREIPSQTVAWGSVSLLDAERRLLANALLDFSNERFVLLSESCIPVFNFPTVYQYLTTSMNSFVESYDDPSQRGRGRYHRRMFPTIKLFQWRKGSEWFELNRKLAVDIIADVKYYSVFAKHCRPSCYPDEHYIPTYLNMFHGDMNSNRTITWVDWSRGGPHPAQLGRENITESFIQSIINNGTICTHNSVPTSVCFLFARKFSPSSLGPLLRISPRAMKF
ncbi:core-2/I-branching beta-1,6-N-acetylglucosaminyltransferase family protein [Wolffia australiana]